MGVAVAARLSPAVRAGPPPRPPEAPVEDSKTDSGAATFACRAELQAVPNPTPVPNALASAPARQTTGQADASVRGPSRRSVDRGFDGRRTARCGRHCRPTPKVPPTRLLRLCPGDAASGRGVHRTAAPSVAGSGRGPGHRGDRPVRP